MNDLKVEVKAVNAPVSVSSTTDGKRSDTLMTPDKPLNFEPKEALKIRYAKSLAQNVQLTLMANKFPCPRLRLTRNETSLSLKLQKTI
jgi:hypothetical protein